MSHSVLDEKKIDTLVSSYHDAEQLISEGSDEHLDVILEIQKRIKKLTQLSVDVNQELEDNFNSIDEETAKNVVIKLTYGLRIAKQVITILKKIHPSIFEGIKSCHRDLYVETKQIEEFVQDLIKYRINKPVELIELLKGIK